MTINVETGVPAATQESSFMNATLQSVSETHSMSIAVHLPPDAAAKAGVDLDDKVQVARWLGAIFASASASGCEIEVKVGLEEEPADEEMAP